MSKWHRWRVYSLLKSMDAPTTEDIAEVERMDALEAKEGLLEWLTVLGNDEYQQGRAKAKNEELQKLLLE